MTEERRLSEEAHAAWRTRIDIDVRSLSERLAGVETGMSALGSSFDRFAHTFEASERRQQELGKTRWPVVFGSLTLALIVVGGFLSGYVRDLNRIERNVEVIRGDRKSAEDPRQDVELKDLNAEVTSIRANEHETIEHAADSRARIRAIERHLFNEAGTIHVED